MVQPREENEKPTMSFKPLLDESRGHEVEKSDGPVPASSSYSLLFNLTNARGYQSPQPENENPNPAPSSSSLPIEDHPYCYINIQNKNFCVAM